MKGEIKYEYWAVAYSLIYEFSEFLKNEYGYNESQHGSDPYAFSIVSAMPPYNKIPIDYFYVILTFQDNQDGMQILSDGHNLFSKGTCGNVNTRISFDIQLNPYFKNRNWKKYDTIFSRKYKLIRLNNI